MGPSRLLYFFGVSVLTIAVLASPEALSAKSDELEPYQHGTTVPVLAYMVSPSTASNPSLPPLPVSANSQSPIPHLKDTAQSPTTIGVSSTALNQASVGSYSRANSANDTSYPTYTTPKTVANMTSSNPTAATGGAILQHTQGGSIIGLLGFCIMSLIML